MLVSAFALLSYELCKLQEEVESKDTLTAQLIMDRGEKVLQIGPLVEQKLVKVEDLPTVP